MDSNILKVIKSRPVSAITMLVVIGTLIMWFSFRSEVSESNREFENIQHSLSVEPVEDIYDSKLFPVLIYVNEKHEQYASFFRHFFDRIGIPHTSDYNTNWTMCWGSFNFPEKHYAWQKMNRLFGTQRSCTKKGLCESMWRSAAIIDPQNATLLAIHNNIFATCFILPDHWKELKEYDTATAISRANNEGVVEKSSGGLLSMKNLGDIPLLSPPKWVLKLDGTSGGSGVYLASDLSDIVNSLESCKAQEEAVHDTAAVAAPSPSPEGQVDPMVCKHSTNGIVQEYVQKPLLLDGRRFSMRLFVLYDSFLPLRAFVSYVSFALITGETETSSREGKNLSNMSVLCPWVTNWAMQSVHCPSFEPPPVVKENEYFAQEHVPLSVLFDRKSNMWSTLGIFAYLKETRPDLDVQKVWSNAKRAVGSALLHSYPIPAWRKVYTRRGDQLLLGVDTTIMDDGDVVLFEINCHPFTGLDYSMMHKMREVMYSGMIQLTGSTMYLYKKSKSDAAKKIVDEFCSRPSVNCTSVSRISLRDTEIMLQDRYVFDIAVPSLETMHLYKNLLKGDDYHEDRLLARFVEERLIKLDRVKGDLRLLKPTEESVTYLETDMFHYDPTDLVQD